jgi:hypothetical protein
MPIFQLSTKVTPFSAVEKSKAHVLLLAFSNEYKSLQLFAPFTLFFQFHSYGCTSLDNFIFIKTIISSSFLLPSQDTFFVPFGC